MSSGPHVTLTMSLDQAHALKAALELSFRAGLGQFEYLEELMRLGSLIKGPLLKNTKLELDLDFDRLDAARASLMELKSICGYHASGSWGIHYENLPLEHKQTYATFKALDLALRNINCAPETAVSVTLDSPISGKNSPTCTYQP